MDAMDVNDNQQWHNSVCTARDHMFQQSDVSIEQVG